MTDHSNPADDRTAYEKLSTDLGIDVDSFEAQLRLRRDLARIHEGQPTEMGFVMIARQNHPDALVVFDTPEAAAQALDDHPLIDDLCTEDSTLRQVIEHLSPDDLTNIEVILA